MLFLRQNLISRESLWDERESQICRGHLLIGFFCTFIFVTIFFRDEHNEIGSDLHTMRLGYKWLRIHSESEYNRIGTE